MNKKLLVLGLGILLVASIGKVTTTAMAMEKEESDVVVASSMLDNVIDVEAVLLQSGIVKLYDIPEVDEHTPTPPVVNKYCGGGNVAWSGIFECTAYCNCISCCGQYSPQAGGKGTTKSGTYPRQGRTIAVDPRLIPLGTKVVINGNVYIAEDTGGAIKGHIIDIYFESHADTNRFGRRKLEVKVLK